MNEPRTVLGGRSFALLVLFWAATSIVADEYDNTWPAQKQYADPGIARAMDAVRLAIPKARQDPARPVYHFRPPAQWMNDICGALFHKGTYHIFYQLNPFGADMWGVRGSSWAHARSRDLVHWDHLPVAIVPAKDRGEMRCNSGCVTVNGRGVPMIFYTYVPEKRGAKRQQWAAVARDEGLVEWEKVDANPLMAAGKNGIPASMNAGWSDPFVFRSGGRTFVTFKSSGGAVCEARNVALTEWKYAGRIDGVEGECPNFFGLQGRWLLLRSTYPPSYQVGQFDPERMKFHMDGPRGIIDYAYGPKRPRNFNIKRGFYGTNVLFDGRGRCILLGWVSGFKTGRGWNGCMSLPRILTIDKSGRLIQTPAPELKELRKDHKRLTGVAVHNEAKLIPGVSGTTLEIVAEIVPGSATACGLKLRSSRDGNRAIVLKYSGGTLNVAGTKVPVELGKQTKVLKLHVFLDRSVMEVFINGGRKTVTRVEYPPDEDLGIAVFAEGGKATLKSLDVWKIEPVWKNRRQPAVSCGSAR